MLKMRLLPSLALVFLLFVMVTDRPAAQDIKKAGELYNAGKFAEAYSEFEKVYRKNQKDLAAFNGMAWSRLQSGKLAKAEQMFKSILRKEPFHAGAKQGIAAVNAKKYERFNTAWNFYYTGDFEKAKSAFRAIIDDKKRLLPENEMWRTHLGLGYSLYGGRNDSDAKKHFKESLKLKENYDAFKGIGLAEFRLKRYKEAISAFTSSIKLNPSQYDVSTLIAWSYFRSGETDRAIEAFRKQLSVNSYVADVHYGLALALDKKGDKKAARDRFYSAMSLLPGHLMADEFFSVIKGVKEYKSLYRDLGWTLYFAGLARESLDVFERGLKYDSGNAPLLRGAGFAALKIKHYDKSIKYAGKSLSLDPELPPVFETSYTQTRLPYRFYSDARTTLAWAYFNKKDYTNASKEFRKALELRPDWPDANSGLGWVYYSLKKYEDAEEQFNKAVKLDSTYYDAYSGLTAVKNAKLGRSGEGWKYYYLGQFDKAIHTFHEISRKKKLSAEAKMSVERGLGWSSLRLSKYDTAGRHFKNLIKADSKDADAVLGLGYVLYGKEKFSEATEILKIAVKAFPLDVDAEIALGWSYYRTNNFADSLVEFRRAVQLYPNLAEPHRGVGFALVKLGRIDEGKASLVRAINLFPGIVDNDEFAGLVEEKKELKDLYITLAWSYYNFGRYNDALKKAKLIDKGYSELDMLLGFIYFNSKQYDNAIKSLEGFLANAPDMEQGYGKYSKALYTLGWSYYNKKDYTQAFKTFETFSKLHEKDDIWATPYDGMGWSLAKSGKTSRAKEMFEQSLKRAPGYASSLSGLKELTHGRDKRRNLD